MDDVTVRSFILKTLDRMTGIIFSMWNRHIFSALALYLFLTAPFVSAEPLIFLDDQQKLSILESQGFSFSEIALRANTGVSNNEELSHFRNYQSLIQDIKTDLRKEMTLDSKLSISMRSTHRLFDIEWLSSKSARFELVGIINRLDREPFNKEQCGEIRFIYRLAYRITKPSEIYSRLPMTLNAVYWIKRDGSGCRTSAESWNEFSKKVSAGNLKELGLKDLPVTSLKSLELNLQSVRWPSTIRPDMAGYAEYLLRAYKPEDDKFTAGTLENTPDTELLTRQPADRNALLEWLKDPVNLKNIDLGIAKIPDRFLSRKTTSVALHGVHRYKNAPFSILYKEQDLEKINYSSYRTFQTPHGLLRRLNDLSCTGCHQGRTIAGFHFLGKDHEDTQDVNAIAVSASPHFIADLTRRISYTAKLLSGESPAPQRGFSVRAEDEKGQIGSHCGLGDPSFKHWVCEPGLKCKATIHDNAISRSGVCLPEIPLAGSSCHAGTIKHDFNPQKDKIVPDDKSSCGESGVCEASAVGFPGGMCSGSCNLLRAGETCGSIAILQGFNECLSRGKESFAACLKNNVRPAALQYCDEKVSCRDDYICARTASGKGGCIPPYFLFQLRVDGHHSPGQTG